jgi:hypothetical protein
MGKIFNVSNDYSITIYEGIQYPRLLGSVGGLKKEIAMKQSEKNIRSTYISWFELIKKLEHDKEKRKELRKSLNIIIASEIKKYC